MITKRAYLTEKRKFTIKEIDLNQFNNLFTFVNTLQP